MVDSMNTQLKTEFRSGDSQNKSGVVFPTMILCADSMHSHFKIQQKYPQVCDIKMFIRLLSEKTG